MAQLAAPWLGNQLRLWTNLDAIVTRQRHCERCLSYGCCRCRKPQRLHHRVMQRHARGLNLGILPRRMHAIAQQHHEKLPVRINPDRSACKSGVPKAVPRKIVPARSAFGRHRPAQRPRPAGKLLRRRKLCDCRAPQYSLVRINAAVKQHLAKRRYVR